MYIEPKYIIGKSFYVINDSSNTEYECVGYGEVGTSLIIGATFDSVNNRSSFKLFKLTDVKLVGKVTTS